MANLFYTFFVARYVGADGGIAFDKPIRTIAAHPIAAAERVLRTRLYLLGDPQNIFAEVSYTDPDGQEERVLLYCASLNEAPTALRR
ncbi:MAG: hypothetical protein JWR51_3417 [Devosia sp.]|uniref:hypothetical protein n=1 Tax=Devosia sp. TaxID=1871048 RepID=UPI0026178338|nr:hypothetical protein [Devosia sp.]MDB5530314.1 hypothetical protein [Devosia sp.]